MNTILFILMMVAMLSTLLSLAAGVLIMGRGGDLDAKYSNKLMQLRLYSQGAALLLLVLFILTSP